MDPTRTVLSGFNSSLWNFQIYFQCMYFLFWREGDRLVRIPTLTHERPRIINLTHGSKDRALGLGQRLQRFNSLFTHSAQVSRVWHETNFSALILRFRRRVNWWVGGGQRFMYSPTGGAVLVKSVKVAVSNQFAPVHTRLDCAQASKHSHLKFPISLKPPFESESGSPAQHCRSWG